LHNFQRLLQNKQKALQNKQQLYTGALYKLYFFLDKAVKLIYQLIDLITGVWTAVW
jgi:hypothetical protein